MFTFFEWHTQQAEVSLQTAQTCFRTICLLFLSGIHNAGEQVHFLESLVLGLYVYFF